MQTTRRGFIGAIAAALTLDPEKALWIPGAKLISIPKPSLPFGFRDDMLYLNSYYGKFGKAVQTVTESIIGTAMLAVIAEKHGTPLSREELNVFIAKVVRNESGKL